MKVFDLFMYSGENDLLDIRLNTHDSFVDKFYILEGTKTHSCLDKPLYFEDNKERFSAFKDKIVYISCDYCKYENAFYNDWAARVILFNSLNNNDCIILHSDLDEIICPEFIASYIKNLSRPLSFEVDYFMFCLDLWGRKDVAPILVRKDWIKDDFYKYRDARNKSDFFEIIKNSTGWHYSSVGKPSDLVKKWNSFAHYNEIDNKYKDENYIISQIKRKAGSWSEYEKDNVLKSINHYYPNLPKYVIDNKEKFKHLFFENY